MGTEIEAVGGRWWRVVLLQPRPKDALCNVL